MTFNDDADLSRGRVSKRGRNGAIIGGGGGLVVIALLIVSQLTGVDLTGLAPVLGGSGGGGTSSEETLTCSAEEANASDDCRVLGASASLETYWSSVAAELGFSYTPPQPIVIFDGATDTGCGGATSAVGPFYCPADQTIYLDTAFYGELRSRFDATGGPLAQMYIIGHEWGHHVQSIAGISEGLDLRDTGPASDSVRLELQADCFAGAWIGDAATTLDSNGVTFLDPVTQQEVTDALDAAAAVGDDRIQEATAGQVNPEGWTHGSSEQRQRWFMLGYNGSPDSCGTFAVDASQL